MNANFTVQSVYFKLLYTLIGPIYLLYEHSPAVTLFYTVY